MKKQLTAWLLALVMLFSLVGCGADAPVQADPSLPQQEQQDAQNAPSEDADMPDETAQIDEDGSYTTKDDVALYIHTYGHLPDNFITKKDAQALGWPGESPEPYASPSSLSRRANALAAAGSATTKVSCPRRTDAPTPNTTSTRWARIRAGPNASSSQTTASFITPKTTTSPLNCCTGRSEHHALCIRCLRLRDR